MTKLVVGPFNRVEGDLEVSLDISEGKVVDARINAPLFRGFELMLQGKDPRDALTITPRICGICSISQSHAAARALGNLAGISPPPQGQLMANIIHATENLADHVTHFYLFFMCDFTRESYKNQPWYDWAVKGFSLGGERAREMIEARAQLMHIMGMLAGKWPHSLAIQPGGVTYAPNLRDKLRLHTLLRGFRSFLENTLFGASLEAFLELDHADDLASWQKGDVGQFIKIAQTAALNTLGKSSGQLMSFGAYGESFAAGIWQAQNAPLDLTRIHEDIAYSWMNGKSAHPDVGMTIPDDSMNAPAYSWCKAPRLGGVVMETGALARQVIDGQALALELIKDGSTVFSRVMGRIIEIARTQVMLEKWVEAIEPRERFITALVKLPDGEAVGTVEAARGALGHWLRVENGRIANYQIIAPTSWNFSPRDDQDQMGAAESALIGAPVLNGETTPVSVQHIIRSFDPCMVCTVH